MPYCTLPDRAVVSLAGDDVSGFLDALVTNNVHLVTPTQAIYAALLTPQGKYLFDFFIAEYDGRLLLDCEAARKDELIKRLKMYKLRAKIDIVDESADMHKDQSGEFSIRAEVFSPLEVLRCATSDTARLLNREGELGVVAPDAYADLIAVDGNPLDDLTVLEGQGQHIPMVVKGGEIFKLTI